MLVFFSAELHLIGTKSLVAYDCEGCKQDDILKDIGPGHSGSRGFCTVLPTSASYDPPPAARPLLGWDHLALPLLTPDPPPCPTPPTLLRCTALLSSSCLRCNLGQSSEYHLRGERGHWSRASGSAGTSHVQVCLPSFS